MMDDNLTQNAIDFALNCNWLEAIKINLKILKSNSSDLDALNRLSKAYYENGELIKAKKISKKVVKLEPNNAIANRAIDKYKFIKIKTVGVDRNVDPSVFIEETGKTRIINLINVGSNNTCVCLGSGDEIFLVAHTHKVSLENQDGKYIGRVPDDLSATLRKLIKGGNKYKVYVKSVEGKIVKVLIKEISRGEKFKNTQSFPKEQSVSVSENFPDSDL